mgnify:CR=1 FL=1
MTFENIIMEVATRFVNVPQNEFESRLNESLKLIGSYLDVDRVYVFEYDFNNFVTSNTYEWCAPGVNPEIQNLQNVPITDLFDEWVTLHKQGEMVIYEDVLALDPSSMVYQILKPQMVLSICTIPLMHQNECLGFVGFDDISQKRSWTQNEMKLLKVLAELILNAMVKQQNDLTLIELRERAQSASAAKGNFLAQMSHEIRTPLNGISNAIYLLNSTTLTDEQKNYMDIARNSTELLSTIINSILDLSKIEAGKMQVYYQSVDLETELVKTLKTIRPSVKVKNLKCIFEFDYMIMDELILDIHKINQIILNLVGNAIKYTKEGYIKTRITTTTEDAIEYLQIEIEDTGIGIREEDQVKIFDAFFQAHDQNYVIGTGLGLHITYELISLMHGKLKLKSTFGSGSTFTALIPFTRGNALVYDTFGYHNVLYQTEDATHGAYYKKMLESMGFSIDEKPQPDKYYDLIIYDDYAFNTEKLAYDEKHVAHERTLFLLFTVNHVTHPRIDYIFDIPISRKALMQRLLSHLSPDEHPNQTLKSYQGHVLLVDDNKLNLDAFQTILQKNGLTVDVALSGLTAIGKVKHETYDLIFMDIQMPGMDGYETSRYIRQQNAELKRLPIVAVTANAFLSDYDIKNSSFIDDILYKPIQIVNLFRVLDKYLNVKNTLEIPTHLSIFNREQFLVLFEDSINAGNAMIEQFFSDSPLDLRELHELNETRNEELIYRKLHYLKGSLSYLAAEKALYLVIEFMSIIKKSKRIDPSYLDQLDAEVDNLYIELRQFKSQNIQIKPSKTVK